MTNTTSMTPIIMRVMTPRMKWATAESDSIRESVAAVTTGSAAVAISDQNKAVRKSPMKSESSSAIAGVGVTTRSISTNAMVVVDDLIGGRR